MNFKEITLAVLLATTSGIVICSCETQQEKDAKTKTNIEKALPGITADVHNGRVIISGAVATNEDERYVVKFVRGIKGVTAVENYSVIVKPKYKITPSHDNELLITSAHLLKAFPGVNASVKDGTLNLEGEINKADWLKLAPQIALLHPKEIHNKLMIR